MNFTDKNVIRLPIISCLFLDLPNGSYDCASEPDEINKTVCIWCPVTQTFFSGESLNDFGSPGHIIVLIMGILAVLIGTFGTVANLLIILILRQRKSGSVFDTMLTGLAVFDFIWSVSSLISAISIPLYLRNPDRSETAAQECFLRTHFFAYFSRSGSSFVAILIAFERYLVISRPVKAALYITPSKIRISVICMAIIAVLLEIPRFVIMQLSVNIVHRKASTAQDINHILMDTHVGKIWQATMHEIIVVNQIDYLLPFPLLVWF